jgi:hypothetical protein
VEGLYIVVHLHHGVGPIILIDEFKFLKLKIGFEKMIKVFFYFISRKILIIFFFKGDI